MRALVAILIIALTTALVEFRMAAQDTAMVDCTSADAGYNQALMYQQEGSPDEALALLDCLIANNPPNGYYYNLRGTIYRGQQDYTKARLDFEETVLIDDMACPCALANLGKLYEMIGSYEMALDYFRLALNKATGARDLYYGDMARVYLTLGEPDKALAQYATALEEAPAAFGVYLARAGFYAQQGDTELSAADYLRYAEANTQIRNDTSLTLFQTRTIPWAQRKTEYLMFEGEAGDLLTVIADADPKSPAVDPLMVLLSPDGTALTGNDDLNEGNLAALITHTLAETGRYTLVVTHALGFNPNDGTLRLTTWLESTDTALSIDNMAVVMTGDTGLNVRAEPDISARVRFVVKTGDEIRLVDGPRFANGYRWWQVERADGTRGWAVDEIANNQQLRRLDGE